MKKSINPSRRYLLISISIYITITQLSAQETGTVTDIDGNVCQTVKIGDQWWMAENLKVSHYRNGDEIPNVTDGTEWDNLTIGAYCNYDNDETYVAAYGRLYNWYAVNDSRSIAPEGWHVPSDAEWKQLEMYLGLNQLEADGMGNRGTDEGGKLKETGTSHWNSPNKGATNESGFSALPCGYRNFNGDYLDLGSLTIFWSSTENNDYVASTRGLSYDESDIIRISFSKRAGFSVRCIQTDQTSIHGNRQTTVPTEYLLYQNYPNPFNSSTRIHYELHESSEVNLSIYNSKGQVVRTFDLAKQQSGGHIIVWDGKDNLGNQVSSGVYLYTLNAGRFQETKKALYLK